MDAKTLRKIDGKLPTQKDMQEWSPEKRLSWIEFGAFFTKPDPDQGYVYDVTDEKIDAAWLSDRENWSEFMQRIEVLHKGDVTRNKRMNNFQVRLMNALRSTLTWLKKHPADVTPEMLAVVKGNARLSWAVETFKFKTTESGAEIVAMDMMEAVDPDKLGTVNIAAPEVAYQTALAKTADILNTIVGSISDKELRAMSTEDKLKIAATIMTALGKSGKPGKSGKSVFNTIVLAKAGRQDLEKMLSGYTEKQADAS